MTDTKYNGWTNYATWRVNLEIFDGMDFDHYPTDDELREYAETVINEDATYNSLAHSYAMAFLSDVNWSEIASHFYYVEESENE